MQNIIEKIRNVVLLSLLISVFFVSNLTIIVRAADASSPASTNPGEWKSIIFGQSTSNNQVKIADDNQTVTLIAGTKDGSLAGGKITGSHDGISYYYTEIPSSQNFELSAKITVNYFAKPTPDNQEGFGIMARDAIGKPSDSSVFASNMVLVGGYRGALQSVFRNNVKEISGMGATMDDVFKFGERPANDGSATYLLRLRKTNTGYHVAVDNQPEKIYYRPKQLEVIDPDRIYVGFFAARIASITVSNITLKTSAVATDPPGVAEPAKTVAPIITVTSPVTASTAGYQLNISLNVKGKLVIEQAGAVLYNGPIDANQLLAKDTTLVSGPNAFNLKFTPDTADNTKAAEITFRHVVNFKTYGAPGGIVYVAPNGLPTAAGTVQDPIDIDSALQYLQPGQTIYVRAGIYHRTAPLVIAKGNNGTPDKLKMLAAAPNERPIFDFGKKTNGFTVGGDYWKIAGIDVTGAASNGVRVSGHHNLLERINTYANGDTGLQISGAATDKPDQWPSHNLVLNCTSYDNRDASENNADGFAAKLTCGVGNVFRGCIAYHNCDDGFDLYSKLETGPIGAIIIEDSIAYGNGTLSDGTKTKGDGNGFKLGGEGLAVKHVLRNSLAFANVSSGVTSNSDPAIIVENTTSVDNGKANFNFFYYSNATPQFIASHNLSLRTVAGGADTFPASLQSDTNYFYDGNGSVNASGKKVTTADFKKVTPGGPFQRNPDGSIAANDFMALASSATISGGFQIPPQSKK